MVLAVKNCTILPDEVELGSVSYARSKNVKVQIKNLAILAVDFR